MELLMFLATASVIMTKTINNSSSGKPKFLSAPTFAETQNLPTAHTAFCRLPKKEKTTHFILLSNS
jgi:hypothetical protein